MTRVVLYRGVAGSSAGLRVGQGLERNTTNGRQDKSADLGRAHVVGWIGYFRHSARRTCWRSPLISKKFQRSERRRLHLRGPSQP
jgi:hypothetical protein